HPNDLQYPGGPPVPPYDIAGWTLAIQMAVQFDRVFELVKGPFMECRDIQKPLPGEIVNAAAAQGFFFRADVNDAFRVVNRLLAPRQTVQRLVSPVKMDAGEFAAGSFYIPNAYGGARTPAEALADELGVTFIGSSPPPANAAKPLRAVRVGL